MFGFQMQMTPFLLTFETIPNSFHSFLVLLALWMEHISIVVRQQPIDMQHGIARVEYLRTALLAVHLPFGFYILSVDGKDQLLMQLCMPIPVSPISQFHLEIFILLMRGLEFVTRCWFHIVEFATIWRNGVELMYGKRLYPIKLKH